MIITWIQIIALLPVLIIGATTVIILLSIAYRRNLFLHALLTIFGLIIAMVSLEIVRRQGIQNICQSICIDNFAIFYIILVLVSSLASAILAYSWLLSYPSNRDEFYLLLLISSIGGMLLASTSHLGILFLGIELISLPLFGLIGYSFFKKFSLEASIKYIILSGISSSFILFGIALIYAVTGCLSFTSIIRVLNLITSHQSILLLIIGLGMVMIGFGFKLSLVPFHLWTPDVYQGAPSSVSLYLTTSSKIAIISVLIRLFMVFPDQYNQIFYIFLSGTACCSTLFGNLMAIKQNNIKRVLAYSSIAHVGYTLIGVIAALQTNSMALEAIGIYLISYLLANIGAFGVISIMSVFYSDSYDTDVLFTYRGLFWHQPILSILFTIIILSLAGIPMTLGFIGKFYLFVLGINSQLWWLTIFVAMSSVIGIIYYLRIIINLYLNPSINYFSINSSAASSWVVTPNGILVIIVSFFILLLGLYPQPIIYFIHLFR
ncbi:NADH-quinone oxidoreductase subunit NuoN [Blochmannia endosymbiont of Camponotus sp.]|uniref:NADH-quinone oxidoreductase subunit NuoN n=1 Tax=Blochmannia endosymbiont of Camponotus sp. TaxID=700220 RepID=UPI00202528F7|nr:NADH-quinone oxidoreductase subunit NuoN [Blochmannia endosymbiont of Camponotus sp.]URJ31186.1 NADH-quinone oxidoreductase subunit NuoN [Blochmannia endosymbiont of Camponotus sp.]